MYYLVAKKFSEKGCIAIKTKHGKSLQQKIGYNGVQLVTISRPSAYGEYEPYKILENQESFEQRILNMG